MITVILQYSGEETVDGHWCTTVYDNAQVNIYDSLGKDTVTAQEKENGNSRKMTNKHIKEPE